MNRLVLIGNGFDLAHDVKTSYKDFVKWYWMQRRNGFVYDHSNVSEDVLCKLVNLEYDTWLMALMYDMGLKYAEEDEIYDYFAKNDKIKVDFTPFFDRINKNIENKGWVDIENEYYELLKKYALEDEDETKVKELNEQLHFIQDKLIEYLALATQKEVKPIEGIEHAIYGGFKPEDIAIARTDAIIDHVEGDMARSDKEWKYKLKCCGFVEYSKYSKAIREFRNSHKGALSEKDLFLCPFVYYYPNHIMILNFNYTNIAELYNRTIEIADTKAKIPINYIHGTLDKPESVIFGYGDEMDEKYKEIVKKNDNQFLGNIKSIKYLEEDNYRNVLDFIESEPYQIIIMGHSCGNSDRTLLNTLFEHRNCVSIKPYYHKKEDGTDNYLELVQNISRNFTDMKLMRDRVVNKTYCEPLKK